LGKDEASTKPFQVQEEGFPTSTIVSGKEPSEEEKASSTTTATLFLIELSPTPDSHRRPGEEEASNDITAIASGWESESDEEIFSITL
jgi:hypothetical protein